MAASAGGRSATRLGYDAYAIRPADDAWLANGSIRRVDGTAEVRRPRSSITAWTALISCAR